MLSCSGPAHSSSPTSPKSRPAQGPALPSQGSNWSKKCNIGQTILPNSLLQEFVNPDMVPFVLPSALYIAQEVSVTELAQNHVQLSSGKQSGLCATCSSQSEACDEVDGANPDLADIHAGALLRFCPKTSGHVPAFRKWSCSWRKPHLKMSEVMFSPWCIGRSSQEFHRFRNFAFP